MLLREDEDKKKGLGLRKDKDEKTHSIKVKNRNSDITQSSIIWALIRNSITQSFVFPFENGFLFSYSKIMWYLPRQHTTRVLILWLSCSVLLRIGLSCVVLWLSCLVFWVALFPCLTVGLSGWHVAWGSGRVTVLDLGWAAKWQKALNKVGVLGLN